MNRLATYVLVLVFLIAAYVFVIPQNKILEQKRAKLELEKGALSVAEERKDAAKREARALQEDPEYMELKARDVLNYYFPGEVIFEVNRSRREEASGGSEGVVDSQVL